MAINDVLVRIEGDSDGKDPAPEEPEAKAAVEETEGKSPACS